MNLVLYSISAVIANVPINGEKVRKWREGFLKMIGYRCFEADQ